MQGPETLYGSLLYVQAQNMVIKSKNEKKKLNSCKTLSYPWFPWTLNFNFLKYKMKKFV